MIRLLILALFVWACTEEVPDKSHTVYTNSDRTVAINQYLNDKDKDVMDALVKRKTWKMQFSDDGYYYEVLQAGEGAKFKSGDQVEYWYQIYTLDGKLCYSSDNLGSRMFKIAQSEEIKGLHLACQRLQSGAKARFIFPPVLAFGLPGDLHKIPPRACLVYEILVK